MAETTVVEGTDRSSQAPDRSLVISATGLSKAYGSVQALSNVDLDLYSGEIVALAGDNGAGKSTLVAILSGLVRPDAGDIHVAGQRVALTSPAKAHQLGIVTVFQDLALVNERDVAANIFMGRELTRFGLVIDRSRMINESRQLIRRLQVGLPDVRTPVKLLSGGQRQAVAVARSIVRGEARVVIMDEPTAALGVREAATVTELIRALRAEGRTILLVSHNIESVFGLADRVVVLRLGRRVADLKIAETTYEEVVGLIVRGTERSPE
jgi:ABC-type sugar transport system ATPase subunit